MANTALETEIGHGNSGLTPWSAFVDVTETVPELAWPSSINTYSAMRTDAQIASLLLASPTISICPWLRRQDELDRFDTGWSRSRRKRRGTTPSCRGSACAGPRWFARPVAALPMFPARLALSHRPLGWYDPLAGY
jgi:hypothetical protein